MLLGNGQTPLPFLESLPKFYAYEQLAKATGDFTNNNLIGVGGCGQVFRGKLPGAKVVAIKKLNYSAGQDELEGGQAQFETEIKTISGIRHRNLVEVVGHCSDKADKLFVCEFVPNK
ncbi:proline-rich receptor-like protein kinase PERK15 [Hevea brasiliensis]|uniref:proline-rich receptor-like protein kinase PERK15 n=1 Tax=Hevea brasiliensis TaxID=3981 RepID=UPI0025CEEE20|nr:proline-rich receptor-like protein kinase PERK15 [Hevea brasiliensis]